MTINYGTAMEYRLEMLKPKMLVGKRMTMSLAENRTAELWKSFLMEKGSVNNTIGTDLYSMQVYSATYFNNFDPASKFEKWATIEVSDFKDIPSGMKPYTLPGGLYAVFLYRGSASAGAQAFQYIFTTWLPASGYVLDSRPHFEILGAKYKNNDPTSEEEIWIPIKPKTN